MRFAHVVKGTAEVKLLLTVALALVMDWSAASGLTNSEVLVVLGAGNQGPWVTEFVLANNQSADVLVGIGATPEVLEACPSECTTQRPVTLSANGTVTAEGPVDGFPVEFIKAVAAPTPPARARIFNSSNPQQAVDLPVFRLAALIALNPNQLVFGVGSQVARANLLLANLRDAGQSDGSDVTVSIEAFSADGQQLASRDLTVPFGQPSYVVNIGQFLGVPNPAGGQIRVTKTAGTGIFWGILPSVNTDATISITLGEVP
jgi:hypothetical protein